ncbi:MAG: acyl-CoA thioesterase [Planctomycetota bacterium]|jgi:4-hydroxybenzoyl-CoA thioesterase
MNAFRARVPVRFGEVDRAGVVYYPQFFHYFHVAFEQWWEARGIPYPEMIDVRKVGFPAVKVECSYRRPLRFGDEPEIEVVVKRLGGRSVTFGYRVFLGDDERPCAEGSVTTACVDMDSFSGRDIPEDVRTLFEADLQG